MTPHGNGNKREFERKGINIPKALSDEFSISKVNRSLLLGIHSFVHSFNILSVPVLSLEGGARQSMGWFSLHRGLFALWPFPQTRPPPSLVLLLPSAPGLSDCTSLYHSMRKFPG